jgi:hypothetical protein
MLIAMGQPDANGNLIPSYIQEGSAVFSNPRGRAEPRTVRYDAEWMTLAVCAAFCNPRRGTSGE